MGATRPAVFLDRDGVINRNVFNPATGSYEAPLTAAGFALAPGAVQALHNLQSAGYLLFVVSNQPNYSKGKASLEDLASIDQKMRRELDASGVVLNGVYYCLHHPLGIVPEYSGPCGCRKPSPYFLLRAIRQFRLDPSRSWMIGDRETDILCGHAAGVRTIYISETSRNPNANFMAPDLLDAATLIQSCTGSSDPSLANASMSNSTRRNPDSRSFASYHSCGV
ncbi:MAG: D-glycero-alpha-D-manno-heptose-1,7-bisphosphate 7-phosphatase [Acidobacteriaceae bacterium]